jgi:ZIP family zinc transporter
MSSRPDCVRRVGGIALASGIAAALGNWVRAGACAGAVAIADAVAAGAILAMLVDTMIPEATDEAHDAWG